jgi:hypothetical protein
MLPHDTMLRILCRHGRNPGETDLTNITFIVIIMDQDRIWFPTNWTGTLRGIP